MPYIMFRRVTERVSEPLFSFEEKNIPSQQKNGEKKKKSSLQINASHARQPHLFFSWFFPFLLFPPPYLFFPSFFLHFLLSNSFPCFFILFVLVGNVELTILVCAWLQWRHAFPPEYPRDFGKQSSSHLGRGMMHPMRLSRVRPSFRHLFQQRPQLLQYLRQDSLPLLRWR